MPEEEKFVSEIAGPRHGRIRRTINSAVAHHRSIRIEPMVRALCEEYLDPIVQRGHGELVSELAVPLPINVIAHFVGIPRDDWPRFRQWTDDITHGTYPTLHRNERGEGLAGAHPEFAQYLDTLIAERAASADPPDDVVSRLLDTDVDGRRLSQVEIRSQVAFIVLAGNETTRQLLGNLLVRLVTDRALFARLQRDRSLVERAVEESLRIDPPFPMLLRNVERDTDVFGEAMCPGEKAVFGLASANRDETHFAHPDQFELDRGNWRDHIAFGAGPHVCPGASLARSGRPRARRNLPRPDRRSHARTGLDPPQDARVLRQRTRRSPGPCGRRLTSTLPDRRSTRHHTAETSLDLGNQLARPRARASWWRWRSRGGRSRRSSSTRGSRPTTRRPTGRSTSRSTSGASRRRWTSSWPSWPTTSAPAASSGPTATSASARTRRRTS